MLSATAGLGADVVLEMSGADPAVHQALELVRVGGRVQMLGIPAKPMDVDFATEVIFKGISDKAEASAQLKSYELATAP